MSALLGAVGIRRATRRVGPGRRAGRLAGRLAGAIGGGAITRKAMRHHRRRGISGAELRGFKKVARLLSDFGMRPRGLAHPLHRAPRRLFSRRHRGDPISDGD